MVHFLLDQGLPRSAVDELEHLGMTADHAGAIGLARATDEEILAAAGSRGAVVVTLDADFHSLLAAARSQAPSMIRVRMEGLKGKEIADVLQRVVAVGEADLASGAAISVTHGGIRIRRLPLV